MNNSSESKVQIGPVTVSEADLIASMINSELTSEAQRVVASMPKWIPGTQNGKAVRVNYVVPITFRLQ